MQEITDRNLKYCEDMVRTDDRDRYLAALFVPRDLRPYVMALYAFNQEVAKTHESVSEPMIGEIRLQWWREALDQIIDGHVREHPVVESLAKIPSLKKIMPLLQEVIDARQSDLYHQSNWSIDDLKNYADQVGGALSEALLIAAGSISVEQSTIARDIGRAWSLLGIIRALPFHGTEDGIYSSFTGTNASANSIEFEALEPTIKKIIVLIEGYIVTDRSTIMKIDKSSRPLLLLNSAAIHYLKRLKRFSLNPFELAKQPSNDTSLIIRLVWASLRGRF